MHSQSPVAHNGFCFVAMGGKLGKKEEEEEKSTGTTSTALAKDLIISCD